MKKPLDKSTLSKFNNTERWHEFSTLTPTVVLSDGAKYVADYGGAYWLMDIIGLFQSINYEYNQELFQHWTLKVEEDSSAHVVCEDGNNNIVYRHFIPYTEFPLRSIDLYAVHVDRRIIIMLPGEY